MNRLLSDGGYSVCPLICPAKSFTDTIARVLQTLDPQSRSMMVQLDVMNRDGALAPGMYPTVDWPVSSEGNLLFVPATSVVTTTERTFVITTQDGHAHRVDVKKGPVACEQAAVRGSSGRTAGGEESYR